LDLLDTEAVETYIITHTPSIVIHTATLGDSPDAIEKNTRMYINLARMNYAYWRMFNLSSGAVYGRTRELSFVREGEINHSVPSDPYGYSKYLTAQLSKSFGNIVDLYLFGIYGPGEAAKRFPTRALALARKGDYPVVYQDRAMSYLWIGDFLHLLSQLLYIPLDRSMESGYNMVPDKQITLSQFARTIIKLVSPQKGHDIIIASSEKAPSYTGNNDRIKSLFRMYGLDWRCVPIEDTIFIMDNEYKEGIL
jgi:GDP-L-fucose synthase